MIRLLGAILMASTALISPAIADPISIGSFVISGLLSAGAGGLLPAVSAATIGYAVLGAAALAVNIASAAFMNRRPKIDPGEFKNVFETGESSELRAIGRVRVAGLQAFGNTVGVDRYRLICHVKGPWTATEEHYLGGREVVVDSDGAVSSPPWSYIGGSYVHIKAKTGSGGETAWPELISAFPALWTSAHRVRGIAQTLVRYISPGLTNDKFLQLYQSGEPPYERVGRAEPIFDPREVGQSATNPATWVWSDNGILCGAHVLRSYPSISAADIDYTLLAAQADAAEEMVATLTGTEPRARCWGMWPSESARGDVMQQVLDSIGAEMVPTSDDKYIIRLLSDARTAEIDIPARHILGLEWRSGPESVERPNVCRVRYYSPERNFEMAEIDLTGIAWARVQEEIDRVGEQIYDVDLPFCPSASQAQRIARRMFALARADAGVVKTNWAGLAAWGKTTANIELPDIDETALCAIANPRVNDDEGTVEIPFVVWPTLTPWNPATDEAPAPDPIPDLQYPSDLPKPNAPTAAMVVTLPSTAKALRVAYSLPSGSGATIVEANYRIVSLAGTFQGMTEHGNPEGAGAASAAVNATGEMCEFRVRTWDDEGNGSYFSDVYAAIPAAESAAAPAAPSLTLLPDSINPQQVRLTQSGSLQATTVQTTGPNSPGTVTLAPYEQYTWDITPTSGATHTWTARAFNSAAVGSSTTTISHEWPGA